MQRKKQYFQFLYEHDNAIDPHSKFIQKWSHIDMKHIKNFLIFWHDTASIMIMLEWLDLSHDF